MDHVPLEFLDKIFDFLADSTSVKATRLNSVWGLRSQHFNYRTAQQIHADLFIQVTSSRDEVLLSTNPANVDVLNRNLKFRSVQIGGSNQRASLHAVQYPLSRARRILASISRCITPNSQIVLLNITEKDEEVMLALFEAVNKSFVNVAVLNPLNLQRIKNFAEIIAQFGRLSSFCLRQHEKDTTTTLMKAILRNLDSFRIGLFVDNALISKKSDFVREIIKKHSLHYDREITVTERRFLMSPPTVAKKTKIKHYSHANGRLSMEVSKDASCKLVRMMIYS